MYVPAQRQKYATLYQEQAPDAQIQQIPKYTITHRVARAQDAAQRQAIAALTARVAELEAQLRAQRSAADQLVARHELTLKENRALRQSSAELQRVVQQQQRVIECLELCEHRRPQVGLERCAAVHLSKHTHRDDTALDVCERNYIRHFLEG